MITHESVEVETGVETPAGGKIIIKGTPTGYYKLMVKGTSGVHKFEEDTFTNLRSAKIAVEKYRQDSQPEREKKQSLKAGIERRTQEFEAKEANKKVA